MKKSSAFALVDMMILVAVLAILAGLLLPALAKTREEARRKRCAHNLMQIAIACITYQDANGDYFPCHWDGRALDGKQVTQETWNEGYQNPMQSLALLFPAYVDNDWAFACPSTADRPKITRTVVQGSLHACFGTPGKLDPSLYQGMAKGGSCTTDEKCSYLYDPQCHFRVAGPGQAVAADADGYVWRNNLLQYPEHRKGWQRVPPTPNHHNGQNVMYFDGHVKYWLENVYCSDDPNDNIFAIEVGANPDADAVLWDEGCDSRDPMTGQYPDAVKPE